jgi:two-component system response regulator AtoC
MIRTLIVEDKESFRHYIREVLKKEHHEVFEAAQGNEALELFGKYHFDLVLLDLRLPGKDGIAVTKEMKKIDHTIPIIILTAYGTVDNAVTAMKLGIFDFIEKPVDPDRLVMLVNRALREQQLIRENVVLREELSRRHGFTRIIGKSQGLCDAAMLAKKVARSDSTVLLTGESGTGKELLAHAIHDLSLRKENPFIAVNCAAIPAELFENELFGSEKGAFTGAHKRKIGMVEVAHQSTLFLDEVSSIPLGIQSKFLRFLQEKTFTRLGGNEELGVDVRVIAATNRNLIREVGSGNFREDLYYRLSVFPIELPPLRKRKGDILLLADYFINRYCKELRKKKMKLMPEAEKMLKNYRWPGNIRELQNIIERAVILTEGNSISPEDIGTRESLEGVEEEIELAEDMTLKEAAAMGRVVAEKKLIAKVLLKTGGNKTKAAKLLGMSYKTLLKRIKGYGL